MKKILLLTTLFLSLTSYAQNYLVQVKPAGSKLWGYANEKGEMVIAAQYKQCFPFSEHGLAPIYDAKSKQHNFINTKGEVLAVEKPGFILMNIFGFGLKNFSEGLVPVSYAKKWGFMDTNGKLVIEAKYDKVTSFSGGYATAQLGTDYFIIDKLGKETSINSIGIAGIKDFSEGLSPFSTADKLHGFFNTKGEVTIAPQFKSVGYFSAGLAYAKNDLGKVGFINKKGEWIIQPIYDAVKDFSPTSKLARVKVDGEWSFIKTDGTLIKLNNVNTCGDFYNGLAYGKTPEGLVGFLNEKGEWAIEAKFEAAGDFSNGFAAAKSGGLWGLIDTKGNWVTEPKYDGIKEVMKITK